MKTFRCETEMDTMALGAALARTLPIPSFVALYGDLGAGKTALTRGLGEALGATDVTSPTFTIVHEYDTRPALYHFDAYRLDSGEALLDVGFADYLQRDGILLMEWAELVEEVLPAERLNVTIIGSGDEPRVITLEPLGRRYEKVVDAL